MLFCFEFCVWCFALSGLEFKIWGFAPYNLRVRDLVLWNFEFGVLGQWMNSACFSPESFSPEGKKKQLPYKMRIVPQVRSSLSQYGSICHDYVTLIDILQVRQGQFCFGLMHS